MIKKSKGEKTKATVQVKPKSEIVVQKHGIVYKIDEEVESKKITTKAIEIKPTNVYSADYKLIDDTIEEIKKASRKVSTNDYATNNVYILLQDVLKKVVLAEK